MKVSIESKERPSYEQLKKDLEDLRFVSHVAKKYDVSNSCITRWLANYEKYNDIIKNKPTLQETKEQVKETPKPEKIKKDKYIKNPKLKEDIKPQPNLQETKEQVKEEPTLQDTKKEEQIDNKKKKCFDCDNMIFKKCTRCTDCNIKHRIKTNSVLMNRPSLEQIKKDIIELKSMVKVGNKYNVSDNAIRKWIANYQKIL